MEKYVKVGSSLRLTCRVYLGPQGPDQDYRETAVVHWFQDQRLLDPILDSWRPVAGGVESGPQNRVTISSEFVHDELQGYLQVDNVTPYDAGNYTCVPSYAIPDWVQVHILHGKKCTQWVLRCDEVYGFSFKFQRRIKPDCTMKCQR